MEERQRATNIYQMLKNDTTAAWLTVNGFTAYGSDYDRFRKLCICADRTPDAPILSMLQEVLKTAFSCHLQLGEANCKEIWRTTAEMLMLSDAPSSLVSEDAWRKTEILPPDASEWMSESRFLLNGMQIHAETWDEWAKEAEQQLQKAMSAGKHPTVWISSDFNFQKPNLYRVERHLRGIEKCAALWMAQMVYFLCCRCSAEGLRGVLLWDAEPSQLLELLQYVSKLTPLPNLCVRCDTANASDWLRICEAVINGRRGSFEGIPPVVIVSD